MGFGEGFSEFRGGVTQVCVTLRNTVQLLFPKEFEEIDTKRKKEHQQKRLFDLLTMKTESTSARARRLTELQELLDEKIVDVNGRTDENLIGPLNHALQSEATLDVVKMLVTAGADVNACCLHCAINKPRVNLEVVKYLVEKGATAFFTPFTHLCTASSWGHLEVIKFLVEKGADVNKGLPLCIASEKGHLEVVKVLVEAGADLNKTDQKGRTPLHIAAEKGYQEITHILVKAMYNIK